MNRELVHRILTSLVLLPVLMFSLFHSGFYLLILLFFILIICFYEILKNTKNIIFNFVANILIVFALFSFYHLRGDTNQSLIIIYWILSSTFLSDIGGYFVGKIFKGKKLTKISPNKTYSGSIGSVIFSLAAIPSISYIQQVFFEKDLINFYQLKYFTLTILISIVCQLGDICVSYYKRKIGIKNISNILPGHGGVLDRIDGLIFVLIFSYILKIIGLI